MRRTAKGEANVSTRQQVIVEYVGGDWDGGRDDLTGKPGLPPHPPIIGTGRTTYVLDHVVGDVGYYRPPTEEELDRPVRLT